MERCRVLGPGPLRAGAAVPGSDGTTLLVDVKFAYRRDGQPVEAEFQLRFSEALKAVIH